MELILKKAAELRLHFTDKYRNNLHIAFEGKDTKEGKKNIW